MANKQRIFIGNEYKESFNSICELILGKCLDSSKYSCSNGVINDGVYEYVLSEQAGENAQSVKHGFGKNGATWFKALRGEPVQSNDAIWTTLIDNVKSEFHKAYSIVEYQEKITTTNKEKSISTATEFVNAFTKRFFPDYAGKTEVYQTSSGETFEDVYGVAMRIELSGGTGASLPILGKVYFNKTGNVVRPIASRIASSIDSNLSNIVPEDADDSPTKDQLASTRTVISTTLDAMDRLVKNENLNFADYLCYVDESDHKATLNLYEKLAHDAYDLECQKIDVLYITHIKVGIFNFDVYSSNNPLFKLTLGLNNTFSVQCLNCGDQEFLVNKNEIACNDDGIEKIYTLDTELDSLGLDDDQVYDILATSSFRNHFLKVSCPSNSRHNGCSTIKCRSQLFETVYNDEVILKCSDCPYPESVYTNIQGDKKYTPLLIFAKDKMELIDKTEDFGYCVDCQRAFSLNSLKNRRCPTCQKLLYSANDKSSIKTYNKYKNLLPLSVRFFSLFKKKYCVEDDEMIIFVVGKNKYIFNKSNVTEQGYIPSPVRIK